MFGGWSDEQDTSLDTEKTIGRLDIQTRKWANVGNLVNGRVGHNAIYDGNFFLVVGGGYGNIK